MTQRTTLLISAALAAFVLGAVGALVGWAGAGGLPVSQTGPAGSGAPDAAAYQRQLAEANARLEQANRQLEEAYQRQRQLAQQLQDQQGQPGQSPQPPAAPQSGQGLTPEQAALVAQVAAPGASLLAQPELVDLQGVSAYEVRLDRGTVYVDASGGKIIAGTLPSLQRGRHGRGRGEPEDAGEQEDFDD